jgi:hypothetical protein
LDFSSANKSIGEDLAAYYSGVGFTSQGGVFGYKWSRLDLGYAKSKSRQNPGAPPLVKTGTMQDSFKFKADKHGVKVYNTAPYFKYHQSSEPRSKIPYRPSLGINDAVINIVQATLEQDIAKKIRRAKL